MMKGYHMSPIDVREVSNDELDFLLNRKRDNLGELEHQAEWLSDEIRRLNEERLRRRTSELATNTP